MNNIKIYTSPTCPMCKAVKMLLNKKNIPFETEENEDVLRSKGYSHPPVMEVDGEVLVGKSIIDWINTRG